MGDKIMSGRIKPIKNDADYGEALILTERLVSLDPAPNTEKADQLAILATLIENYEKNHFPIDTPSAADAIQFRMDQLDLRPVDLVPYLGSASRVSEVLSGKRSLTVEMINSLSAGLGIPEKTLLKKGSDDNEYSRNIPAIVFKQMISRGYFGNENTSNKPTVLQKFFSGFELQPAGLYRKSKFRTDNNTNYYILIAWSNKVLENARNITANTNYTDGIVNLDYMREIAKYSVDEENGAKKAIAHLLGDGIKVVVEPALSGAKVDGIVILEDKNHPVIGLSLRYDRLDNFWFTLMHELAHISKHYNLNEDFIYDDLDFNNSQISAMEKEADELASNALVDTAKWSVSPARIVPSPLAASALASELGVHVAIIAGKARYENGNWKYLSSTVRKFTIRDKFKEIKWWK
jgi:HTH-type transcriptional regulator/antitoxin HigA